MKKIYNKTDNCGRMRHLWRRAAAVVMVGALLMGGCTKDEEAYVTLRVNTEDYMSVGKAYVDDNYYTCWSDGDALVINGTQKTITIGTVGDETRCYIDGVAASNSGYWSVFPASITGSSTSYSGGTISNLTLPAVQDYTRDGSAQQMVPTVMTAYLGSRTGIINYHNACVAMKLTLRNNYSRHLLLDELRVIADEAPLNGSFEITGANGATPELNYTGGTVAEENRSVTLDFVSGRLLSKDAELTVYVILPPTDDYPNNKFTIEVTAMDAEEIVEGNSVTVYEFSHTQASGASGAFVRNKLIPIDIPMNSPHTMVLKGLGTESNPYLIYSAEDLDVMQHLVNRGYEPLGEGMPFASAYYKQMASIVGDGHNNTIVMAGPIGTATNNFTGCYDGQHYLIEYVTFTTGLFGYISGGAIIKNIFMGDVTVNMNNELVAGVICAKATNSVIDHCRTYGAEFTNVPSGASYIGCVVGDAVATDGGECIIRNCQCALWLRTSNQNQNTSQRIGGIAGHLQNGSICNSYCMNFSEGTLDVGDAYFGGIVGRTDGESNLTNCYTGWREHNNLSGVRRADICAEMGAQTHMFNCFYTQRAFALGTYNADNLIHVQQMTNNLYEVDGTPLIDLLNDLASDMGYSEWEESGEDTSAPPVIVYE